jgi:hypothetical protein
MLSLLRVSRVCLLGAGVFEMFEMGGVGAGVGSNESPAPSKLSPARKKLKMSQRGKDQERSDKSWQDATRESIVVAVCCCMLYVV